MKAIRTVVMRRQGSIFAGRMNRERPILCRAKLVDLYPQLIQATRFTVRVSRSDFPRSDKLTYEGLDVFYVIKHGERKRLLVILDGETTGLVFLLMRGSPILHFKICHIHYGRVA